MRLTLATLLTMVLAIPALAQSDRARAGNAEFSGFKTYWAAKRESCQPMVSFKVRNISSGDIGPVTVRMNVVDNDKKSVFAAGSVSVPASDLPPDRMKDMAVGADHDISPHECLGDMHEAPFSSIHFSVQIIAVVGQDSPSIEILRDKAMSNETVPAEN